MNFKLFSVKLVHWCFLHFGEKSSGNPDVENGAKRDQNGALPREGGENDPNGIPI